MGTSNNERVFAMPVASVYPHYVTKVTKKGRTEAELTEVISWLTGFDDDEITRRLADETSFAEFFDAAAINPYASLITGSICGYKVQEIDDPLMRKIRYLDKLVDELAKGHPMEKILRTPGK